MISVWFNREQFKVSHNLVPATFDAGVERRKR